MKRLRRACMAHRQTRLLEAGENMLNLNKGLPENRLSKLRQPGLAVNTLPLIQNLQSGQAYGRWFCLHFCSGDSAFLCLSAVYQPEHGIGAESFFCMQGQPDRKRAENSFIFVTMAFNFSDFLALPTGFSLILSFCSYDAFHPALFKFAGLQNYVRLLGDQDFARAFLNTLIFVVATTPVTTALALALALLVNSLKRGSQFFRSVFFLPSIISIVVTATIFKSVYAPVGILNRLLAAVGVPAQAWLVDSDLAMPAIIVMNIWVYTGYYMVLYLAALKAVPGELYEAADVDGASDWQQFFHITLPQIRYMTVFILTVNTIRNWQVFAEIFTLTRGGPVGSTDTLVHHLYETAFATKWVMPRQWLCSAGSHIFFSLLQMRAMQVVRQ